MDLDDLPLLIRERIFCFVDSFSLLSAIQVCREWREYLSSERFLDSYCRTNLGLVLADLPELRKWERVFVDTRRQMRQMTWILDDQMEDGLMRIHMLDFRVAWMARRLMPYYSKSSSHFQFALEWDWEAVKELEKNRGMRRFLIKLMASVPLDVFRTRYPHWGTGFSFQTKARFQGFYLDWSEPDAKDVTSLIEYRSEDGDYGPTLKFALFVDGGWRVMFQGPILPSYSEPVVGPRIHPDASIPEIRRYAQPLVDRLIGFFEQDSRYPHRGPFSALFLPSSVTSPSSTNPILDYQRESIRRLDHILTSQGTEMERRLFSSKVTGWQKRKVIDFLDQSFPCTNLDHGNECDKRNRSSILRVTLTRALRRLINSIYFHKVEHLYFEDSDTSRLIRAFFMSLGGTGQWFEQSYTNRGSNRPHGRRTGEPLPRNFCCAHRAYPETWPSLVVIEVIEAVPALVEELETEVIGFLRTGRGRMEEKYLYSLGYTLRMFEEWARR